MTTNKKSPPALHPDALAQLDDMIGGVGLMYLKAHAQLRGSEEPSVEEYFSALATKLQLSALQSAWLALTGEEWEGRELR